MPSPLVSPEALTIELSDPRLILLDARAGADAKERFRAQHLSGARYVNGDHELAAPGADAAVGGRHPLPPIEAWVQTLARLGIRSGSKVVVYDDKNGTNPAARAWWMLRAVGVDARVLDGGLAAAVAAGLATESGDSPATTTTPMRIDAWKLPTVDVARVEALSLSPSVPVIDARSASRHRGEADPFDPRPGHIPHTLNAPHDESLDASGRMLDADTLHARFASLLGAHSPREAIVYCGSGVTACHLLLAMEHAGLAGAALYVGSFSEWTRSGRPVATGSGT